ncbi:hypothetical protein C5167_041884 [Papaver somniferum]|nr:hypothetical protein C5167_041884 [Papaver somniferum]
MVAPKIQKFNIIVESFFNVVEFKACHPPGSFVFDASRRLIARFQDLENELKVYGYDGLMPTGQAIDGCAIRFCWYYRAYWRILVIFMLRHEESIEFRNLGLRDNVMRDSCDVLLKVIGSGIAELVPEAYYLFLMDLVDPVLSLQFLLW